ncbi:MAG TPA: ion channel [Alphaproteobacteria bacterium]|nr:two pore domain potassium channel family protein [Alphaproteobacteria bacterium]HOO50628.1 ion channel [Alphaproteobacteria bacterium]
MFLFFKLIIGALMIGLTVILHAFVCDWVFRFIDNHSKPFVRSFGKYWTVPTLIVCVFVIGSAIMADIWMWTILFYYLEPEALGDWDTALYFTTSTFTTVGYGDIVLTDEWRILSGTTSINGMILFGWSTAFIFEIMAKLYQSKNLPKP